MEGKGNLKRNEPQHYSRKFKWRVVEEYLKTGAAKEIIQKKYGIASKSAIVKWMRLFGCEDIHKKKAYFEASKDSALEKGHPDKNEFGKEEGLSGLQKKINDLERRLEDEKLRSEAYRRMIEIAERDLNIPIIKKPGTR